MSALIARRPVSSSDVDECQSVSCGSGRCDNTPGSYRCVCRLGYKFNGNTCTGKKNNASLKVNGISKKREKKFI